MKLYFKEITKDNFSLYGDLITIRNKISQNINKNTTQSFFDLANIEILGEDNNARLNIFNAKKRIFPLNIDMLEMHPFSSQVFLPMSKIDFIVLVAPIDKKPDLNKIECFKVSNGDGINFKSGIWHFPLIATEDMNFLVVDRLGDGDNLVLHNLEKENITLDF